MPKKLKFKKLVIIGAIILFYFNSTAQYTGAVSQNSNLSPNAASLFKASGQPSGSYNGTSPIVLPLYSVKSGAINVPVAIGYNNGGIRVQEVASWTGLGWNIFAGGRVSRIVRGMPDDDSYGGMLNASLKPSGFPTSNWLEDIHMVLNGWQDLEPDLYYFECNGLSGKFFLDEFGQVHLISQQPLKIEFISSGWLITDNKGTKYLFGNGIVDQTNISYSSKNNYSTPNYRSSFISSWHLVEIKDMNNQNKVSFSYTKDLGSFGTLQNSHLVISTPTGQDCAGSDNLGDEVTIFNQTDEYHLTKILGANDSLVFHSSKDRKDYTGGRKLDSICLYNRSNEKLKSHHFVYDYFANSGANSGFDANNKRLKLKLLSEFGTISTDSLTHKFDYIENVNLPGRNSKGIDYWGYYNGMDNNTTLAPNGSYSDGWLVYRRENLAERRANPYFSRANTLEKITYPTGGSRTFVYEGNQALIEPGSQVKPDQIYYNNEYVTEMNFNYINPTTPAAISNITINSTEGNVNYHFDLWNYGYSYDSEVKIIKVISPTYEYEVTNITGVSSGDYVLDNGDYRIEVYHGGGSSIYAIESSWKEQHIPSSTITRYGIPYTAANTNVGGIRLKVIEDYDPVLSKTIYSKYYYNLFSDSTLTSGMLISPIRVASMGSCAYPYRDCNYLKLTTQSEYPLSADGGSNVVYPEVRVVQDGNGHVDTEFSFAYDVYPIVVPSFDYPTVPPYDGSWRRGRVINEKAYDVNNRLIKHSYAEGHGWSLEPEDFLLNTQVGYKVAGYYESYGCNSINFGPPCQGCYRQYTLESQFAGLRKNFERVYNGDSVAQEISVDYEYYVDRSRPILKRQRIHLNNGAIKEVSYKYAFNSSYEFVFGLTTQEEVLAASLLTKNYLEPLETTTTYTPFGGSPVLTEGVKYSFDYFNGSNIHLARVRNYTSATAYKDVIFSAYDSKGNLVEKYRPGEAKEVFLWGYNNSYPVAKIIGSDYVSVSALTNLSILNNPIDDSSLRSHLSAIRSSLGTSAKVMSSTYKPILGITSETDSRGLDTFYEYDHFLRLKNVKDNDGNILQSYQYQYKP